ncbi:MAG: hypothetical protein HOW97_26405 [Catenulispora sp.]|nr:hypothetical protein [Catenulispora sp.]
MLWDKRHDFYRQLRLPVQERHGIFKFDPGAVGLYPINRWTAARMLEPSSLEMRIVSDRPTQQWCDPTEWRRIATELAEKHSGEVAYLTDFVIDHRESEYGGNFCYTVTPCDYSEHLATLTYLREHHEVQARIKEAFAGGRVADFARTSPPSLIKINVSVLNRDNRFLAIQRSAAVETKKGLWTVGPNETMILSKRPVPGRTAEDLFGLAERCLREELGLEPRTCGPVRISWIGYESTTATVKVFAQVRTRLSGADVLEIMSTAHGLFEAQDAIWLPFNRRAVADIIRNWEQGDSARRRWSSSAPLALQELWRMRRTLQMTSLT